MNQPFDRFAGDSFYGAWPLPTPRRLDNKRVLMTGAGSALGLAVASALAAAGAEVYLAARKAGQMHAIVEVIRRCGGQASGLTLDIADLHNVREVLAESDCFDVLVNNAGINKPMPMTEVAEEDYNTIFDQNVRAPFFVSQAVVDRMLTERRGGSIIHVSSPLAHIGAANRTLYCASRHAVEGLTKAMAVEFAGNGIRVNAVVPTSPAFLEPLQRPGQADRTAPTTMATTLFRFAQSPMEAAVFLASEASRFITGASVVVADANAQD